MRIQHLINGKSVDSADAAATFETINPSNQQVLAEVADGGAAEVHAAVAAAKAAFPAWAGRPATERAALMRKLGELIARHVPEISRTESMDTGQTISQTGKQLVPRAADNFQYFAEMCTRVDGHTYPTPTHLNYTLFHPVGVCALISPWNVPFMTATWKTAPCLAFGNTAVLKMSELSPMSAARLGELALEAGIPAGVLQLVTGGGKLGEALIKDLSELNIGDPVVHSAHGIGRYRGLVNMDMGQKNEDGTPALQEFLHLEYAGDATITGDVTVTGNLAVTGTASITGALTLDGVDIKNSYTNILARSTTATTTASITAVDLVTLSTDVRGDALSIATDRWARVSFNYRKLATSANAVAFGLKINSTVVIEAANATGVPRSSATQQAESGFGYFLIPPRSTNYGFGVDIDYSTFTTAGAVTVSGKAEAKPTATNAVPNAIITSLAIRAINATSTNSAEVTVVTVETW